MISNERLHEFLEFSGNFYQTYDFTYQLSVRNFHYWELLKCVDLGNKISDGFVTCCPNVRSSNFSIDYVRSKSNFAEKGFCNFQPPNFILHFIFSLCLDLPSVLKICNQVGANYRGNRPESLHPACPVCRLQVVESPNANQNRQEEACTDDNAPNTLIHKTYQSCMKGIIA